MLMFLFNYIPDSCQLLLGLLFLLTTHWTIKTIKEFRVPCPEPADISKQSSRAAPRITHSSSQDVGEAPDSKKKRKHPEPCLTSLQGSSDKGTDPERLSEDLNLKYTLRTLNRNIQYLAWQMQRITGPPAHSSTSNTSVEAVVSVHSSTHLSVSSRSRTPPSPVPAILPRDAQSRQQHLIRPPGAGFQQVRVEAQSHRKVDFNIRQKQLKEQLGGPTPQSESLTRLIPSYPVLHPATRRTDHSLQGRDARILSYKEQELLNWHVQKKHQKEAPLVHLAPITARVLIGNDEIRAGETVHWVIQQRSCSHTPPHSHALGHHTPPKFPRAQSPGPCTRPPVPLPPGEEQPTPAMLICKTESHSQVSGSVQVKVSNGTHKEELAEMLTMLEQRKSPTLKESGRPGTPKEKEKDRHSPGRRPGSPKEDLGRLGRAGSPKDKQAEVKISLRKDQTIHTLSWTNLSEIQRPGPTQKLSAVAQPKLLDPYFMCQNQLELPCVAAARKAQNQKNYTSAEPPLRPPVGTPKSQCLAHTIIQSLDAEQAMRDLQVHLAKALEMGDSEPSVEYPLCLLCGCCTPYCPHPRTQHSPYLLVYPRLDVRDGEAYMTLGFLLKMKRSEADEWGLTQGREVLQTPYSKERLSKKEKSRRTTPRRRSQPLVAGLRPQEPKTPDRTPPVARKLFSEDGDWHTRSPAVTPQASRVITTTPARATPQTPKMQFQPTPARTPLPAARTPLPAARTPLPAARTPQPAARPPPLPAKQVPPKTPEKPPSILKQLLSSIKRMCARVCPEKLSPKKSSPSKKSGAPLPAPVSPEPHKKSGVLSLQSPTSGARVKGDTRQASPLSTSKQEASPFQSATPQTLAKPGTPVTKQATSSKRKSSKDRRGLVTRFKEPDSPYIPKKGASSLKKSASPKTPRKSPSVLKRTPSRQGTP